MLLGEKMDLLKKKKVKAGENDRNGFGGLKLTVVETAEWELNGHLTFY